MVFSFSENIVRSWDSLTFDETSNLSKSYNFQLLAVVSPSQISHQSVRYGTYLVFKGPQSPLRYSRWRSVVTPACQYGFYN